MYNNKVARDFNGFFIGHIMSNGTVVKDGAIIGNAIGDNIFNDGKVIGHVRLG